MSWIDDAACRDRPTWWWFPGRGHTLEVEVALSICRTCPVRRQCLADALDLEAPGERFGIVGGLTPDQRAQLGPPRLAAVEPTSLDDLDEPRWLELGSSLAGARS